MSKSCSQHFFYDENCPACRTARMEHALEEDQERRAEEADEQQRFYELQRDEERADVRTMPGGLKPLPKSRERTLPVRTNYKPRSWSRVPGNCTK